MANKAHNGGGSWRAPGASVIIGATGGIGSWVARSLVEAGGRVLLAARSEGPLRDLGSSLDAPWRVCDARDFGQVDALMADAAERLGGVDAVVNLAGSILLKPAHLTSEEELDETLALNLRTAFACVRAGSRAMRKAGGSIVLMSSCAGSIGLANHEAISAAKAGVAALARSAAATYAPSNIRVNCVAPGLVDTPLAAKITGNEAALDASVALHPLGRIGAPEDVGRAVCWLLSPDSAWVTGQTLGVDGGLATVKTRPVAARQGDR